MRERLQICDKLSIINYVESNQLPAEFGGTVQYDHEAFINRCIEDLGQEKFRQRLHLDEEGREVSVVPIEELIDSSTTNKIEAEPEIVDALQQERDQAIALIDERLATLKQSINSNRCQDPKDFIHLLRYRATRLSLDLSMFQTCLLYTSRCV